MKIVYITSYDPFTYRRPIFAKKALPSIQIFDYSTIYKTKLKTLGKIFYRTNRCLAKVERSIYGYDYILSKSFQNNVNKLALNGIDSEDVITLNNFLASKRIWKDSRVIIDLMDVLNTQNLEEADGVIFWSKAFMNIINSRLKIKKCIYVPHGIDLKSFDPMKFGNSIWFRKMYSLEDYFILTYSGGIWRVRGEDLQGVDNMLRAFSKISKKIKRVVLILQTFNMDVNALRLIKEMGIKDKIIIGQLPFNDFKRLSLFSATDVFIAPTSRNPIAYYAERMKYFQYMTAKKPIVAEESPGSKNVFGDSAYYIQLGDCESMVDGILDLYHNEDLRNYFGEKARERVVEKFEWSKLIPIYRDFITSIVNS
ncbi:MAG: glycosyltransferase [Nitrososphaeria archaeon]